jgi:hypothetical protein
MYDPALLIDIEAGRILAANSAVQSLLGYEMDELANLTPSDIHPHEIPRLEMFLKSVIEEGRWSSDELSCRTKSGAFVPADIRATSVQVFGRQCILALVHDTRSEKLAALGQAVRKVMHDLRNSLASGTLLSDRLSMHDDPQVKRGAETITRSIERAVRLCEQTLSVGHADETPPDRTHFPLSDVVGEVKDAVCSPEDGACGIAENSPTVAIDADYDQVFRILLNLVRNAQTAGARKIEIGGHGANDEVIVDVADDGPGLPETVQARLNAAEWKISRSGGSGLGLVIARELARNHGGDLNLISTGTDGTVFRLVLPRT